MRKQNNKHSLVPQLRFPEFHTNVEWSFQPLGQLAERSTRKNVGFKFTRVLTNSAEQGVIDQRDFFDKDIANQGNLEGYYIVEKGDYVYNPRISATAPVGPVSKNNVGTGVMSPLYTVFRFNSDENDFYAHYFKSKHWHQYMRQSSSTGARHDRISISNDAFLGLPLPVSTPEEEQKISACLSSIDHLIATEIKRLSTLKVFRKGLMQGLFPRDGETVPSLRFPEFKKKKDWEEHSISEMLEEVLRPVKMDNDENYTLVTVRRRYGGIVLREVLKGQNILVKSQFRIRKNDFLISKRQIVHSACAVVPNDYDGAIVSNEYTILQAKNCCDIGFFDYFSQQPIVSKSFLECSVGIVIEKMLFKQEQWLKKRFLFPALQEQKRISSCLSSLDALISTQGKKIDCLQTHKKAMLGQLFPVLQEAPT